MLSVQKYSVTKLQGSSVAGKIIQNKYGVLELNKKTVYITTLCNNISEKKIYYNFQKLLSKNEYYSISQQ